MAILYDFPDPPGPFMDTTITIAYNLGILATEINNLADKINTLTPYDKYFFPKEVEQLNKAYYIQCSQFKRRKKFLAIKKREQKFARYS